MGHFENSREKKISIVSLTLWLAGLTLLIFGYIIFKFLYPMITKGAFF